MVVKKSVRECEYTTWNLMSLIEQYFLKKIVAPTWQRDFVWNEEQIFDWRDTLINGNTIPPFWLHTFKSEADSYSHKYLTDGLQRISATLQLIYNANDYGFYHVDEYQAGVFRTNRSPSKNDTNKTDLRDVIDLLHETTVWVGTIKGSNERDALEDYQRLNSSGTPLSLFHRFKGKAMNNAISRQMFDRVTTEIPAVLRKLMAVKEVKQWNPGTREIEKVTVGKTENQSISGRHALGAFAYWLERSGRTIFWNFRKNTFRSRDFGVEKAFDELCGAYSLQDAQEELTSLITSLNEFVVEIKSILKKYGVAARHLHNVLVGHLSLWWIHCQHMRIAPEARYAVESALIDGCFRALSEHSHGYIITNSNGEFYRNSLGRVAYSAIVDGINAYPQLLSFLGYQDEVKRLLPSLHDKARSEYDRWLQVVNGASDLSNGLEQVYAIRDRDEIKIGRSSAPERRLKELRTARPNAALFAIFKDGVREKSLHQICAPYNIGREWFKYTDSLAQTLEPYVGRYCEG